ncbi:MAG: membrane protein [Rhodomicrobium sp.]|nr:MAG: membrane protein [Rhodomicrobium sp.]
MNGWDIIYSPLLDNWVLWTLGASIVAIVIIMLINRLPGALLRGVGLALLLLALINPSLRQEQRDPLTNIVVLLADKSPSQVISGREALVDSAREKITEKFKGIDKLDIELVEIDADSVEAKDGTLAFAALKETLSRIPANRLAGVVMITDGQVHDAPKKLTELGLEVPVHVILTGEASEFDRRIEIVKAPRYGIVGASREVKLKVVEQGKRPEGSETVKLTFRQKGAEVDQRFVKVGEEIAVPLQFPHAGMNLMEIEVEEHEDEITTANNRAVVTAEGVRENLRVLLVSGEPHSGERTWRNLLKSDAAVDLVHFTILRPPEKQDGTPIHQLSLIAFPTRELFSEKLEEFDLIIFDRYQRRGVLPLHYLDNVSQYVLNGGAVLIAAGDKFATPLSLANTPLDQILPAAPTGRVIEKRYRAAVTKNGERHPVTHNLPRANNGKPSWGHWFRLIEARINEGETLMTGVDKQPLLVLNRLGEGRIALLLSDHAWLWARNYDGGGPYTTLLRRLSHWLMKEPDLEEESLNAVGDGRSLILKRRSMSETIEPVTVTRPDGSTHQVTLKETSPGSWQAELDAQPLGIHRVKSGKLNALAYIGFASAREMENIVTTDKILSPLVKDARSGLFWTGGMKTADIKSGDKTASDNLALPQLVMMNRSGAFAGRDWMGLLERSAYVVKGVRLIPLMTGLLALGLLLLALGAMWWREGR